MDGNDLLTSAEVAKLLGVTPARVRQLAQDEQFKPYLHTTGGRLWRRKDVLAYKEHRKQHVSPPTE